MSDIATDGTSFGRPAETFWSDVRRRFLKNRVAVGSLVIVVLVMIVSVFASQIAPHGFDDQFIGGIKEAPSKKFWFGTDNLGRDMFSRIVYGAQISMKLAVIALLCSVTVQILIGGLAGWFGGWFDVVMMRLADVLMAVPYIAIALAAVTVFGRKIWVIVMVLTIRNYPTGARFLRSIVMQLRGLDYIEAARASGSGTGRILLTHVLPNSLPLMIATVGQSIGAAIINESAYAFLNVGFIDPTPSWGVLIGAARGEVTSSPWLFWFPALCFVVTITACLFVSEGLRDASDPKLRGA